MKTALTYDDIQLVPSLSKVKSRNDINLKTLVSRRYGLLAPFVASPMDTICEFDMAMKMYQLGGVGCIHRFMSIEEQSNMIYKLRGIIYEAGDPFENAGIYRDWPSEIKQIPIMAAIGVQEEDKNRAWSLVKAGANILLIDVAHGHHQNVVDMIKWCKENLPTNVDIIAGNIVTAAAAQELESAGADGLRVGLGGGCFTPKMKVKTEKGFIKIEDVEIGDKVYTHTNNLREVINKFEYEKNEEIFIINDIECTKNHKFYVMHKNDASKVNDDNFMQYAVWIDAENLTDDYFLIEL